MLNMGKIIIILLRYRIKKMYMIIVVIYTKELKKINYIYPENMKNF